MGRPMKLKKAVEVALDAGFDLPPELVKLVREHDYAQRGVVEVWTCRGCQSQYESEVPLTAIGCECGKTRRKTWPKD